MRGIYTIELEGKLKNHSIFVSDTTFKSQRLALYGDNGLWRETINRAKQKQIDSIVVYLCADDDLLNIWEFSVAAPSVNMKLANLSREIREYVNKLEGSTRGKTHRSRKAYAV